MSLMKKIGIDNLSVEQLEKKDVNKYINLLKRKNSPITSARSFLTNKAYNDIWKGEFAWQEGFSHIFKWLDENFDFEPIIGLNDYNPISSHFIVKGLGLLSNKKFPYSFLIKSQCSSEGGWVHNDELKIVEVFNKIKEYKKTIPELIVKNNYLSQTNTNNVLLNDSFKWDKQKLNSTFKKALEYRKKGFEYYYYAYYLSEKGEEEHHKKYKHKNFYKKKFNQIRRKYNKRYKRVNFFITKLNSANIRNPNKDKLLNVKKEWYID